MRADFLCFCLAAIGLVFTTSAHAQLDPEIAAMNDDSEGASGDEFAGDEFADEFSDDAGEPESDATDSAESDEDAEARRAARKANRTALRVRDVRGGRDGRFEDGWGWPR